MATGGISEKGILDGAKMLLKHFRENECEFPLNELKKKKFFMKKNDLNLVLYTMLEKDFIQQTQKSPPIWKRKTDTELTDDLQNEILSNITLKLAKRPNVSQTVNYIQYGHNNTMNTYSNNVGH